MKEFLKRIAIMLVFMLAAAIYAELTTKTPMEKETVFARCIALAALSYGIGAQRQLDKIKEQNGQES